MAKPLQDTVFSTTFISENVEVDIQDQVQKLGGRFRKTIDLTLTFLIVGERFSEKYNFAVSNGVPLITADTFFDVYHEWKAGSEIDFVAELRARPMKPMEGLIISITNFDAEKREVFRELIEVSGGVYSKDLIKKCRVLVSSELRGRKATVAPTWRIPVVHEKWLFESLRVKAALDPACFDLRLPEAEMGVKLSPPVPVPASATADERPAPLPKRRKSDLLFGGGARRSSAPSVAATTTTANAGRPSGPDEAVGVAATPSLGPASVLAAAPVLSAPPAPGVRPGLFAGKTFALHGFDARQTRILRRTIESHRGRLGANADYIVVSSAAARAPPAPPASARVITEWAIERSLDRRAAALDDAWGAPVYTKPTAGFTGLAVCVSGFTGIEQRHVVELIKLMGATFAETLTRSRDLLIARSAAARKVPYAAQWDVPVASAEWLWQSAQAGRALPLGAEHALDGRGARAPPQPRAHEVPARASGSTSSFRSRSLRESESGSEESAQAPHDAHEDNVGYHDEDAEARARLLIALGERPATPPPAEPATLPAATHKMPRRAASRRER